MSLQNVAHVIQTAASDPELRRRIQADPDRALTVFDLTMTEIVALKAHDAAILQGMGLDAAVARRWETLW